MLVLKRLLFRMMATLLLMTVMAYSFIGYHHHQGLHVCMAVEHLLYNSCTQTAECGEMASSDSHGVSHHVRNCSMNDQYRGVAAKRISLEHHVQDWQPVWLMTVLAFQLLICFSRKIPSRYVPEKMGRISGLPPGGQGLRAPPFH